MPNLFTPERQPGESQKDYRVRRRESREAAQAMALRGPYAVFGGATSREHQRRAADMRKRTRYYVGLMNHFRKNNRKK